MGSYLHIYAKLKEQEKPVNIASFRTSSSEFYFAINNVINLPYYSGDGVEYLELSSSVISDVIDDLKSQIANIKHRINIAYRLKGENFDEQVGTIVEDEDYFEDRIELLGQFKLLYNMVVDVELHFTDIEKFLCYVS